jgi:hypothetical protein
MKTTVQEAIELVKKYDSKKIPYNVLLGNLELLLEKEQEQIGQFMNWFIKHYSTATIDGMFGWINSMEEEVTLKEILDDYYNQNK